jgi:hypothetical protein
LCHPLRVGKVTEVMPKKTRSHPTPDLSTGVWVAFHRVATDTKIIWRVTQKVPPMKLAFLSALHYA